MNQELGSDPSDEQSTLAILKAFYQKDKRPWTECVIEFNTLLSAEYIGSIEMDLDFENKEAEYYIIADTYVMLSDLCGLYNHLSGSNESDVSIQFAKRVKNDFLQSVEHFKEKYEWIFNPPILPGINKHTIGRQLRTEFQQHYGSYAEITYLLANGNALEFDRVNKMKLSEYLALGEYLIRKRAVESVT